MADSWIDFESISADRPISSAITVSGWRGNIDRAISQSGYFCSVAYQSSTTTYVSGSVSEDRFQKIDDSEFPVLIRNKEDGDSRDLRVVFSAYTGNGLECIVRITANGGGVSASSQVSIESSTAVVASTTITGVYPGRIVSEFAGPAGFTIDEPSVVWIYFSGMIVSSPSSTSLSIQEITVEEIP